MNFKLKFLPFFACFASARALLHVLYYPPPHTHVFVTYSSTLPPRSLFLFFTFFSFCYYGVCLPLPLCLKVGRTALMKASAYGHTATVKLLLGAGADKDAKSKVRERKNYTHTHMCLARRFEEEEARCNLPSHRCSCS